MDFWKRYAPVLNQVVVLVVIIAVIICGSALTEQEEEVITASTQQVAAVNENLALPDEAPPSNLKPETAVNNVDEAVATPEIEPGENPVPPANSTVEPVAKPEDDLGEALKVKPPEESMSTPVTTPDPGPAGYPADEETGELANGSAEIPVGNHTEMIPGNEAAAPAEAGDREKTVGSEVSRGHNTAREIVNNALRYLGAPYRYGGTTPAGFDCSGYVRYVFSLVDIQLPRSSRDQASVGTHVDKGSLLPADLVFFKTDGSSRINHVGIYLGGNNFVHASRTRGIVITSLDDKYYSAAYYGARRVINQ